MSKPSRNATGAEAPGQIVNPAGFDRYGAIMPTKLYIETVMAQEQAAKEVIDEVLKQEQVKKKMTFAEWCKPEYYTSTAAYYRLEACWRAAQEYV